MLKSDVWNATSSRSSRFFDAACKSREVAGQVQKMVGERVVGLCVQRRALPAFLCAWPRLGELVYFELDADKGGLQSTQILRLASREEVEQYVFGPEVEYKVIPEHTSNCPRKRKRRLPSSGGSSTRLAGCWRAACAAHGV